VKSRYAEDEAKQSLDTLVASGVDATVAERTYTARLLGADPALVLHGGGNTSAKGRAPDALGEMVDVLYIKGSGWDLATIEPPGHPAVRLEPLKKLRALDALSDDAMVALLRLNLLDPSAPTPSIETLLHAFLPARVIDHTHADAILALADQAGSGAGEKMFRQMFGKGLVWVPYVMPGFTLAKRCAEAFDAVVASGATPTVIVLEKHGVFTFGDTAKASYEAMIAAITRAERWLADARKTGSISAASRVQDIETELVPSLRGLLARLAGEPFERGPFLTVRAPDNVLAFLDRRDVTELVEAGCATPDHVIRTKPTALYVAAPDYSDLPALRARLEKEIVQYASKYDAYFAEMCAAKKVTRTKLDPWPRVILLPGFGMCAIGRTLKDADIVADIYEHTVGIMTDAADVGRYEPVSRSDLFDLEYWALEQAKIKKVAEPPLFGKVAVVTGAASGIGRATAEHFVRLGAHVALLDRDPKTLVEVHDSLSKGRRTQVQPVVCDVTSWKKVSAAFGSVVSFFGGIDIVVSNAGTASGGRLDTTEGDDALRASLEVNLLSHNHVARAASEILLTQGHGGAILFNASKSAFNQGPGFGPYAIAKAALVSLMRQYAVDLGKHGIRANAVNADRVRTNLFEGGLVESRAAARGLTVDAYFQSNLLEREVLATDVAEAFAYLAQARATTGCIITVDGGNAAAFPR
jgi:rhamnose utilization protein RhaD (predicted bifunctional aldolase and dehydrogenase)/NAD(P)-dependent dehydrogenase (short-subunit alcohol dehydrogenase family)